MGRPRKRPANLPPHIDLSRVPAGIYWQPARQCWYVRVQNARGTTSPKRVAGADARMSDLHAIAEQIAGVDRSSLRWLCAQFAESAQWRKLSASTRKDYEYCARVLCDWPTKAGKVGELVANRITRPLIQRLIDAIAGAGETPTPSKAVHVQRYLSRVWEWGLNRGYVSAVNPATGIDRPTERKLRRLPDPATMTAITRFAYERGQRSNGTEGALPSYVWAVAEIAYLCRLRGVEVVTLMESAELAEGLRTNRRKGSRDNIVAWTPRLRAAWSALIARRDAIWHRKRMPIPISADQRPVVVGRDGRRLSRSGLSTAWQDCMLAAVEAGVISEAQRFGLHDLKRRGITDTTGTRADKQDASGHRSDTMMDVYDLSLPVVPAAGSE